jgi:hypothetical protein
MAFIGLLVVLFLGQVFMNESFYNYADASGADASGNISLSISDLLALLGSGASKEEEKEEEDDDYSTKDKYYRNMRADMMYDVKNAVRKELLNGKYSDLYGGDTVLDDSCIDSFSSKQGADFMKYIPGKNPDDYIRKDSVPCYGCSVP